MVGLRASLTGSADRPSPPHHRQSMPDSWATRYDEFPGAIFPALKSQAEIPLSVTDSALTHSIQDHWITLDGARMRSLRCGLGPDVVWSTACWATHSHGVMPCPRFPTRRPSTPWTCWVWASPTDPMASTAACGPVPSVCCVFWTSPAWSPAIFWVLRMAGLSP